MEKKIATHSVASGLVSLFPKPEALRARSAVIRSQARFPAPAPAAMKTEPATVKLAKVERTEAERSRMVAR